MRTGTRIAVALAVAVAAAGTAFAVTSTTVKVTMKEWGMTPVPKVAKAGKVNFRVHNAGKIAHQFIVVKTNLAPGKLPVSHKKVVLSGLDVKGELAAIKPGNTKSLPLTLPVGKYVLFCNLKAHYQAGQYRGFSVVRKVPIAR